MNTSETLSTIIELANSLLELMGTKATVDVVDGDVITINIDSTEEMGLLIGKRGDTLSSFQIILGLMIRQKVGEWKKINVNIGDWRQKQEDYLKSVALDAAGRVRETGKEESLYNLNPGERRMVHIAIALAEMDDIETESVGEGKDRYLVVRLKTSK